MQKNEMENFLPYEPADQEQELRYMRSVYETNSNETISNETNNNKTNSNKTNSNETNSNKTKDYEMVLVTVVLDVLCNVLALISFIQLLSNDYLYNVFYTCIPTWVSRQLGGNWHPRIWKWITIVRYGRPSV